MVRLRERTRNRAGPTRDGGRRFAVDRRSFVRGALLTAGSGAAGVRSLADPSRAAAGAERIFEVVSTEEAELFYRFTVEGEVEKTETGDTVSAGGNDAIVGGADDATRTVRGFTGNPGYGDAYEVDGEFRSFQRTGGTSDFDLYLDGREVSPADLGGPDETLGPTARTVVENEIEGTLEIVSTEEAELYYDFTVDGEVEKTETSDTVSAGSNDAIVGGADEDTLTARGFTGNPGYGDAYEVDGTVQVFRRVDGASDFFIRLDGERLRPGDLARLNVDPASDCLHDRFRRYSQRSPLRYENLRDELASSAREAETNRMLSQANVAAIHALKAIARLHYGDYVRGAGEFLAFIDESVRLLAEESDHPMYHSLREYTRTAQFVHDLLYDSETRIEEYVELVDEAADLRHERDAESMRAALELALRGYTGEIEDDVRLMAVDVGELPLDSAVTGLEVNAQRQLVMKTFAESQLPVLEQLARLTRYRQRGALTEREMYQHFACRQAFQLAMYRFSNHILHLQRLGEEESVLFRIASEINNLLGNDLIEAADQAAATSRRTYNRHLEAMAEFDDEAEEC